MGWPVFGLPPWKKLSAFHAAASATAASSRAFLHAAALSWEIKASETREASGSETARVHHAARRRDGVAARGVGAAAGDAGSRVSQLSVAWSGCAPSERISSRSQ